MAKLIKAICTRCDGSGNFSFNLVRGTVCFGCEGAGFKMVDPVKVAAAARAKAKRKAAADALHAKLVPFTSIVVANIQRSFGPFEDTESGWYGLDMACRRANNGKSVGDVARELMWEANK